MLSIVARSCRSYPTTVSILSLLVLLGPCPLLASPSPEKSAVELRRLLPGAAEALRTPARLPQAADLPAAFTARFADGRVIEFAKSPGGLSYTDDASNISGFLSMADLQGMRFHASDEVAPGVFQTVVETMDGLATRRSLVVQTTSTEVGQVAASVLDDQGERVMELTLDGSFQQTGQSTSGLDAARAGLEPNDRAVIVIVISAAVATGVTCMIVALVTDCVEDCSAACSEERRDGFSCSMQGASEGWCGTCECVCQCGPPGPFIPTW